MVTISSARNAVRLSTYHEQELTNAEENYYTQKKQIEGEWRGQLATKWGLTGPVSSEHFTRLSEGQHPLSAEPLIQHRIQTANSVAHRAGWDATFSAPKSVSLTALIGSNQAATAGQRTLADEVAQAHREAARIGTDYLERFVEAHLGGNKGTVRTGEWVAALFDHDCSRPVNGYAAPQLHTHVVFFNLTETPDGKPHALNEKSLFEAQQFAKTAYQSELRYRLERLGFTIELGKNNAPEITGYTAEYRKANSSRNEIIEERAEQIQRQTGCRMAEARQRAALETREAKPIWTPEIVRSMHLQRSAMFGNQERAVLDAALARQREIRAELDGADPVKAANEALTYARDHLFENEAVNLDTDLVKHALLRGEGRVTLKHVEDALAERKCIGEFITLQDLRHRNATAYTTSEIVQTERENIALMNKGRGANLPLVAASCIREEVLNRFDNKGPGNQREAAHQLLTSRDTIQGLQGAAGTGKTFTLRAVREEVEAKGWTVRGFAPTSKATKELADTGMKVSTLQSYLIEVDARKTGTEKPPRTVFVLDETSLADARQVNKLIKSLGPQDRLILVGDVRQHEAVGAGRAFAQLQEQGMQTAQLTKIIRQKDAPDLKHVVELFYEGRVHEGVQILHDLGCIKEIKNERDRYEAIAQQFMQDPDHTLIVSPDNQSRQGINGVIHRHLQDAKQIDRTDITIAVLVNRQDISGAQRTWAAQYEVGNVLCYGDKGSRKYGLNANEYVTVTAIDPAKNTITIQRKNGQLVTYDPSRFRGISGAYRPAGKSFSTGDLIQFTAKSKDLGIDNRDRATITGFTADGEITVQFYRGADKPPGRTLTIDPATFRHIDHAYAVTSYSSQGLTEVNSVLNVDTNNMNPQLINDRLAYVACSRMKTGLTIYCNDSSQLADALARDISKTSAIRPPGTTDPPAKKPPLQVALDALECGQTPDGLDRLKNLRTVVEIKADQQRYRTIAEAYAKEPGAAVVLAPDPESRCQLNAAIHTALNAAEKLDTAQIQTTMLAGRHDLAAHKRKFAASYNVGNVIRFDETRPKALRKVQNLAVAPKEYVTVIATDPVKNSLTVQRPNGQTFTYNPALHSSVFVYRSTERTFAKGERVQFTSEHKHLHIANHQRATITGVTPDQKLTLQLDPSGAGRSKPRIVQIDPSTFQHLDHAYVAASDFGQRRANNNSPTVIAVTAETLDPKSLATQLHCAAAHNKKLTIYCNDANAIGTALGQELADEAVDRAQRNQQTLAREPATPHLANSAQRNSTPEYARAHTPQHAPSQDRQAAAAQQLAPSRPITQEQAQHQPVPPRITLPRAQEHMPTQQPAQTVAPATPYQLPQQQPTQTQRPAQTVHRAPQPPTQQQQPAPVSVHKPPQTQPLKSIQQQPQVQPPKPGQQVKLQPVPGQQVEHQPPAPGQQQAPHTPQHSHTPAPQPAPVKQRGKKIEQEIQIDQGLSL